jgi:sugar lactone lactonase YvrE
MYVAGNHVPLVFRVSTDDRVEVVAGGETFGYSGDGGPAIAAELTAPFGVIPDGAGGFYFSDIELHVVRYVNAEGTIQTVAGNGERGYSGDGGSGTLAQLNGPTRLRLDAQGRLLICDTNNHVIRRLDPDGNLSTLVGTGTLGHTGDGGPATAARLNKPYDVRFSPAGNLYIADTGNNVIRRVDAAGNISTVVGTGTSGFSGDEGDAAVCRLNGPSGVIFDAEGAMWISDTFNERVRRVAGFLDVLD